MAEEKLEPEIRAESAGLGFALHLVNMILTAAAMVLWLAAVTIGHAMNFGAARTLLLAGLAPAVLFGLLVQFFYKRKGIRGARDAALGFIPQRARRIIWLIVLFLFVWIVLNVIDLIVLKGHFHFLLKYSRIYPRLLWIFYFAATFNFIREFIAALWDWMPQKSSIRRILTILCEFILAAAGIYMLKVLGLRALGKLLSFGMDLEWPAETVFFLILLLQVWSWLNHVVAAQVEAKPGMKKTHGAVRLVMVPIMVAVIAVYLVLVLGKISVVKQLELFTIDSRFEFRGPIPPIDGIPPGGEKFKEIYIKPDGTEISESSPEAEGLNVFNAWAKGYRVRLERGNSRITILAIDDKSQDETFQIWPFPRAWHGQLIDNLQQMGAKVVDFDVFFVEKDLKHPGTDRRFAEQILKVARNPRNPDGINVILGTSIEENTVEGQKIKRILKPNDVMLEIIGSNTDSNADWGTVNQPLDADGAARQSSLGFYVDEFELALPSYALTAVSRFLNVDPNLVIKNYFNKFHSLTASKQDREKIELCNYTKDEEKKLSEEKSLDEMWAEALSNGLDKAIPDAGQKADEYKEFLEFLSRYSSSLNQTIEMYLRLTSMLKNQPFEASQSLPPELIEQKKAEEARFKKDFTYDLSARRGGSRKGGWEAQWLGKNLLFIIGDKKIPVNRRNYIINKCDYVIPIASTGGDISDTTQSLEDIYQERSRDIRIMDNFYGYPYKYDTLPYLYYLIMDLNPKVLLDPADNVEGYPLNAKEFHKLKDLRDEIYVSVEDRQPGPAPIKAAPADLIEAGGRAFMSLFSFDSGAGQLAVFKEDSLDKPEIIDIGGLLTALAYDDESGMLYVMSGADGAVIRLNPEDPKIGDIPPLLYPLDIEDSIKAGFQQLWGTDAGPEEILGKSRLLLGRVPMGEVESGSVPESAATLAETPTTDTSAPAADNPAANQNEPNPAKESEKYEVAATAAQWTQAGFAPGERLIIMYHPAIRGIIIRGTRSGTHKPVIILPNPDPLQGLAYDGEGRILATFGGDVLYEYKIVSGKWIGHKIDLADMSDRTPKLGVAAYADADIKVIPLDGSENFEDFTKKKLYVADGNGNAVIMVDLLTFKVQRYIRCPQAILESGKTMNLPQGSVYMVEDMAWDPAGQLIRVLWRAAVPDGNGGFNLAGGNNWVSTLEVYSDFWFTKTFEDQYKNPADGTLMGNFKGEPMRRLWAGSERFYLPVMEPEVQGFTLQIFDNHNNFKKMWEDRKSLVQNRIVLVGPTSEALHDNFRTPFFREVQMPGVEIHGNAAQTMLDRNFMTVPKDIHIPAWLLLGILAIIAAFMPLKLSPIKALFIVVVMAIYWLYVSFAVFIGDPVYSMLMMAAFFLAVILIFEAFGAPVGLAIRKYVKKESMPLFKDHLKAALKRMGLLLGVGIAVWGMIFALKFAGWGVVFIQFRNVILEMVKPILVMVLSAGISTFYVAMTEGREKSRIKGMFSKYVNTEVVNDLLQNPGELGLGGKRMELSIFFSDIRGFTSISERMDAEGLVAFLNEYLTAMTEIVFKYGGTLDKFIGDAVMAVWGAPIPQANHPERAVRGAIEMQETLARMRDMWAARGLKETIKIGCGINTAEVVVGNIGSDKRMDYTVIGDGVNLASRLESITKQYSVAMIISEDTYIRVRDVVDTRYLDEIKVKGKKLPVKIFQVFGVKEEFKDFDPKSGLGRIETLTPEEVTAAKRAIHKEITGSEMVEI